MRIPGLLPGQQLNRPGRRAAERLSPLELDSASGVPAELKITVNSDHLG